MSNIDKQALRGQKVEAPFYLAECYECGRIMPSHVLIESRNYPDGDADCYCPHCNAIDVDIGDLGAAGSETAQLWNYQQTRIEALLDELEAAEKQNAELTGQLTSLFERVSGENVLAYPDGAINWLADTIEGELDASEGALKNALRRIAEMEAREINLPPYSFFDFKQGSPFKHGAYCHLDAVNAELAKHGIKIVAAAGIGKGE